MEGNLDMFCDFFKSNGTVGYMHSNILFKIFLFKFCLVPARLYHVEKFDLTDIIAMTGYIPKSTFISNM